MKYLAPASLCAALLLASRVARADGVESAKLALRSGPATESCGDAASVSTAVERILARPVFSASPANARVAVEIVFARRGDAFHADIALRGDKTGVRSLDDEGPTCDALRDAVAVTVALLLDNDASPPAAPVAPPPSPALTPPTYEPTSAPEPIAVHAGVEVPVGLSFGLIDTATPSFGLALPVFVGARFSLALGGSRSVTHSNAIGAGSVDVTLTQGFVRGCGLLTGSPTTLAASLCVRPAMGALSGSGAGFVVDKSASLLWVSLAAGPELRRSIGAHAFVALRGYAVVPTRRETFSVGNVGEGYRSAPIGAEIVRARMDDFLRAYDFEMAIGGRSLERRRGFPEGQSRRGQRRG